MSPLLPVSSLRPRRSSFNFARPCSKRRPQRPCTATPGEAVVQRLHDARHPGAEQLLDFVFIGIVEKEAEAPRELFLKGDLGGMESEDYGIFV